jgi:hypothetical protein
VSGLIETPQFVHTACRLDTRRVAQVSLLRPGILLAKANLVRRKMSKGTGGWPIQALSCYPFVPNSFRRTPPQIWRQVIVNATFQDDCL